MSRTKAQPLPSLQGEGQGWGLEYPVCEKNTDPTPTPPLQGRGVPTEFHPQSEAEAAPLPCRGGVGVGSVSL